MAQENQQDPLALEDGYDYEAEGYGEEAESGEFPEPEAEEPEPLPDHPLPASVHAEHMTLVDGRRLRPSPRLWVLFGVAALLGAAAAVLAFLTRLTIPAFVAVGLAAVVFLAALFTSLAVRGAAKRAHVDVRRTVEVPEHFAVGDLMTVSLDASGSRFRGGRVRIRETPGPAFTPVDPARLSGAGTTSYRMRANQRGKQRFKGVDVIISDALHLWVQERRYRIDDEVVEVQPGIQALGLRAQIAGQMAFLDGTPKAMKHIFRDVELEQIREFGPGDRMKDVDWKRASRTGEMIVRERSLDTATHALLLFDCGTSMSMPRKGRRSVDVAFDLAHEVMASATNRTVAVGYLAFNDREAVDRMLPTKKRSLSREMVERFAYMMDPIAQKHDKDPSRELMRSQTLGTVLNRTLKSGLGPKTSILLFTDLDTLDEEVLQIVTKVAQGGVKTGVVLFPAPTFAMKRRYRLSGGRRPPSGFRGVKLRKEMQELFVTQQVEFLDMRRVFGEQK